MSKEQVVLQGELRSDIGKGASRRLRRLEGQVPAIIYGGKKDPLSISLPHHKVTHALQDETFYSSVFTVDVGGKKEKVILKDLQRHPYKAQILHMDLQRISATENITKTISVHFINEEIAPGIKAGGQASHNVTEVEIKCLAKNLPTHIDVDVSAVELDQTLHLSDLVLPKDVELTADISDSAHDHPIYSIHMPKIVEEPEEVEAVDATAVPADADKSDAAGDTEEKS
jgi:large subunit ribosomal protein L25